MNSRGALHDIVSSASIISSRGVFTDSAKSLTSFRTVESPPWLTEMSKGARGLQGRITQYQRQLQSAASSRYISSSPALLEKPSFAHRNVSCRAIAARGKSDGPGWEPSCMDSRCEASVAFTMQCSYSPKVRAHIIVPSCQNARRRPPRDVNHLLMRRHLRHLDRVNGTHRVHRLPCIRGLGK